MDTNVNIRPSMTLSVSTNDITLNLNPATKPFDTKDLTVTIGTNNPTGYKLYLTSDSTNLINTEDNTKTIETLPSSTPASGYDQASFPTNYWGYRKSNGSSSSGNYLPFNSDLLVSSSTGPSNETTTSIGLASKIDYLKESGTYSLDFKLNAIPTITQYYMQDLSDPTLASSVCVTEHPTIVFDSRDEQAYMIQRLPDNRCWMLDNLRLDLTNSDIVNILSASNTNADSVSLASLKNGNRANGDRYATAGLTLSNWTSGYSYSVPLINVSGSVTAGVNHNAWTGNYTKDTIGPVKWGLGSGKLGVYYNYCAASAGYYCFGDGTNSGIPTGDSIYSICPSGWNMPNGDTAIGSYYYLYNTGYSSDLDNFRTGYSVVLSGEFVNGDTGYQGNGGGYFSATYNGTTTMVRLDTHLNGVNPRGAYNRSIGAAVRCILKES